MTRIIVHCDIENLYHHLQDTNQTLFNSCEVIAGSEDGNYYDLVRVGGKLPIICDGETHEFDFDHTTGTYTLVPTEDTGNHEVILTDEQFKSMTTFTRKETTMPTQAQTYQEQVDYLFSLRDNAMDSSATRYFYELLSDDAEGVVPSLPAENPRYFADIMVDGIRNQYTLKEKGYTDLITEEIAGTIIWVYETVSEVTP